MDALQDAALTAGKNFLQKKLTEKLLKTEKSTGSVTPNQSNFALIQEVEDPGKHFPYSCKKVKDNIDQMDQQIRQLAELQIFETGEEIDHLEHSLEYEEL